MDKTLDPGLFAPANTVVADPPGKLSVPVHGRPVEVTMTPSARRAAATLSSPLLVEMELYFSCLVRKRVLFREIDDSAAELPAGTGRITDHLLLRFRPVVTQTCRIADVDEEVPLMDMPVLHPERFVPPTLSLDYRHGQWLGEFRYD